MTLEVWKSRFILAGISCLFPVHFHDVAPRFLIGDQVLFGVQLRGEACRLRTIFIILLL